MVAESMVTGLMMVFLINAPRMRIMIRNMAPRKAQADEIGRLVVFAVALKAGFLREHRQHIAENLVSLDFYDVVRLFGRVLPEPLQLLGLEDIRAVLGVAVSEGDLAYVVTALPGQ